MTLIGLVKQKRKIIAQALLIACGIAVVGLYHIRTVCSQGCTIQSTVREHASVPASGMPPCHVPAKESQAPAHSGEHDGFCCKIGELMTSEVGVDIETPREVIVPSFLAPDCLLSAAQMPLRFTIDLVFSLSSVRPPLELSHIPTTVLRI